ncbi:hypothetical protein E8E12_005250 [Didymella heteroderae]|uniref:Uncharacterized protein n=1 Tax=Didymella heteroderae TaxID=1769908 RepID=A0A9P4WWX7_9PLEO|nr:hypothetical protein E8E12_005250 [Didymella heteroderae]
MQFEPHPLPTPYGQTPETLLYSPYSYQFPCSLHYTLNRLYHEKSILSKGLADCVTYLRALREKQAKCIRQLDVQPSLPQKKRKRLQQTKRHLDNEIKNRALAEQAYLINLQACETNLYLANMKAYELSTTTVHAQESTSTLTVYTPTLCSNSESEATDLTWDGWTDEVVVSPFQKKSSNPFVVDDLAPDAYAEGLRRDSAITRDMKRPSLLCREAVELSNSLPVPPNTTHSQYRRSSFLSPAAPVLRPTYSSVVQQSTHSRISIKKLSISSSAAASTIELLQKRRFSTAEIVPIMERFNIVAQSPPHHLPGHQTWGHTAPQTYPQKDARPPMSRQRTNSL